jgi:hypothetical protein
MHRPVTRFAVALHEGAASFSPIALPGVIVPGAWGSVICLRLPQRRGAAVIVREH